MLLDDFYANGKNKTANNMQSASDIFIGLGKVIYNHKQDFVDLLQENNYTESAATMEDCEVCLIPKNDFYNLKNENKKNT